MRARWVTTLVVLAMLAAAGCGDDDDSSSASNATSASTASTASGASVTTSAGGASSSTVPGAAGSTTPASTTPASTTPASSSQGDYHILMIGGLGGTAAAAAKAEQQALQAVTDVVNGEGGINGRRVVIDVQDDLGDPTKAVSILQEKLSGTKPDLVIPGTTSNELQAMLPVLNEQEVLAVGEVGNSTITVDDNPYFFSVLPQQQAAAHALVAEVQRRGAHTLGLMYGADAYGQTAAKVTEQVAKDAGIQVVQESYQPDALDMTAPMQRLQGQKPDLVWMEAIGKPGPLVLEARAKLGWDVPVIGDLTLGSLPLTTLVDPAALNGVDLHVYKIQVFVPEAQRSPQLDAAINALKAQGDIGLPMHIYSFVYDAIWLVHTAAAQAGSTDTKAMAEALEHLQAPQPAPWVTFASYGYSPTNHFAAAADDDYDFIRPGPIVDGMIQPMS
jgi:branched-chain amino acid transport system substrate-binding protein